MKKLNFIIIGFLIFSCSSPLNKKFNESTSKKDMELIKEKLDSTELKLLVGSIIRLKFQDKDLNEMTYSEILEDGKKWKMEQDKVEAEQKTLAEKIKKEEEEKRKRLNSVLTVSMYDKGYQKYDYQDYLTYSLAFENKSEKDIRAFKGSLSITDLFDVEIKSINLTIDDPIKAGATFKGTYTTDYNQFVDEDIRLKNKDMEDLKVVWRPEKIIFSDGSSLE